MPKRIGLRFEEWPASDQAAWHRATDPTDWLDTDAVAARWSPATQAAARSAWGCYLAYLRDHHPAALDLSPAERATEKRLKSYVQAMGARISAAGTTAALQHLLLALTVLAPNADWTKLKEWKCGYERRAVPRDVRPKLVPPDRLLALGYELMATAEQQEGKAAARQYRDGMIIALLAARPMRRRSLASLDTVRSLQRVGKGYVIVLRGEDTKSGRAIEYDVPHYLVARLERYLTLYRPMFPRAATLTGLWLSTKGGSLKGEALYDMICRRTRTAFGVSVNPHLFRTSSATMIAHALPNNPQVASGLLGHSKYETTERHYIQAQSVKAGHAHADTIEKLRSAGAGSKQ